MGLPPTDLMGEGNFMAGDGRAEAHSTILSNQVLWFREHNRVAALLLEAVKRNHFQGDQKELDELVYQVRESQLSFLNDTILILCQFISIPISSSNNYIIRVTLNTELDTV